MTPTSDLATLVPVGHKYAVRVMDVPFTAPEVDTELAPGLFCLAGLPAELPSSWIEWRGTRELQKMRDCDMVLLAVSPSAQPGIFDHENKSLEDRLQRLHGGLSIATPGYYMSFGRTIGGAHREEYFDARASGEVVPYWSSAGTPNHWNVTQTHVRQALDVAESLERIRESVPIGADRLTRILYAFHLALSSNVWDVRLHQFCRVLDGLAATPRGKGRAQFGVRCCKMIGDSAQSHREFFERAYDTRGAIEHLRGPVEEIRAAVPSIATDNEAYLHLAYAEFVLEQVARHALLHVCSTPDLWPQLRMSAAATKFWSDVSLADTLWNTSLDLLAVQRAFNRGRAEASLR